MEQCEKFYGPIYIELDRPTLNAFTAYVQLIAQNYYKNRKLLETTTDGTGRTNNWRCDHQNVRLCDTKRRVLVFMLLLAE